MNESPDYRGPALPLFSEQNEFEQGILGAARTPAHSTPTWEFGTGLTFPTKLAQVTVTSLGTCGLCPHGPDCCSDIIQGAFHVVHQRTCPTASPFPLPGLCWPLFYQL